MPPLAQEPDFSSICVFKKKHTRPHKHTHIERMRTRAKSLLTEVEKSQQQQTIIKGVNGTHVKKKENRPET